MQRTGAAVQTAGTAVTERTGVTVTYRVTLRGACISHVLGLGMALTPALPYGQWSAGCPSLSQEPVASSSFPIFDFPLPLIVSLPGMNADLPLMAPACLSEVGGTG